MKKIFITALVFLATTAAFAQKKHKHNQNPPPLPAKDSTAAVSKTPVPLTNTPAPAPNPKKRDWSKVDLSKRAADHFMVQFGYDNWLGTPDTINIKGFNHSEGFYFMYDFPFKTDARFSVGAGIGIGSSNIYFNQTYPQVAAYTNTTLAFTNTVGGTGGYKKFKLTTTYLELPIELRFALDPEHMDKSWKFAIGTKIGLMLSAYTKGKDPLNNGQVVSNISVKESSKQFFSTPKFAPMVRVSKGVFGIYAQLQANPLIKSGAGPSVFPFSFGFVLSGL